MNMILKVLILAFLCFLHQAQAYSQENGVIILTDDDLTNITSIFPHLFVKYYVPWCRHCQQLAPIFEEIAKELQIQNSTIRLAKINCQENEKAYQFQNIQHFPTLVFYNQAEPLNFDGDRTKSFILKWLTKRLVSPVKQITKQQLQSLANSQGEQVAVVFYGELNSVKGAKFVNIAYQDNYNNYYHIKQHTKPDGTLQILRSFAPDEQYPYQNDQFQQWISQHDRPSVVPLDDRSISSLFRDGNLGVLFFLQNKYSQKKTEFGSAADLWKNKTDAVRLVFVNIPETHQDYFGLLQYMDVNPVQTPIIIINSQQQKKYVLKFNATEITVQRIIAFLDDFNLGKVQESPLESEHAHEHHHHDHDQHDDHNHHHHHHHSHQHQHQHQHDHGHEHHHHDQHDHNHIHQHQDESEHQHQHQHSEDCKHHHHHHSDGHKHTQNTNHKNEHQIHEDQHVEPTSQAQAPQTNEQDKIQQQSGEL